MPVSKANQRAVNKYKKNNYDRIEITVPKGRREVFQARAAAAGESVNAYINAAIDARMAQEDAGGTRPVSLYPDTLKAAQEAAEAAGEGLPQFIDRAVTTQAKRDKTSLQLGINPSTGGTLEKEA